MRNPDIPITPRSRALLLRYEHDRPVIETAARDALIRSGLEGDREVPAMVLHPHDAARPTRRPDEDSWAWAFDENARFAAALVQKEAELGLDHLPVHLFSLAPLVLTLHLVSCLPRRPLRVFQQAQDGTWSLGYERGRAPAPEDFFRVEGLPKAKQGGQGHVALILEVKRSIREQALAQFQARHPGELLATVCLSPGRGLSPEAVRSPEDVSRAEAQLHAVLDALHQHLEGARTVLLAMDCPGSIAAALGSAFNVNTHFPLQLHQFDNTTRQYVPVYQLSAARAPVHVTEFDGPQILKAAQVLGEVQKVHQELMAWLSDPAQEHWVKELGGPEMLRSEVVTAPVTTPEPLYPHLGGTWNFPAGLLLGLGELRNRLGSPDDWKECIRLLILHEVFHVRQGGLTSYNYSGSGRTGFVLEAVDYDADAVAIQVARAWREAKQGGTVKDLGPARVLEAIIWNVLETLRVFEPEHPVKELSERRLRRYLIWLFHACRLAVLGREKLAEPGLERVTIEVAGLKAFPDPHETYAQTRVALEAGGERGPLELAVYFARKLVRHDREDWVRELLKLLGRWEEKPRDEAQRTMKRHFERLFSEHRELIHP